MYSQASREGRYLGSSQGSQPSLLAESQVKRKEFYFGETLPGFYIQACTHTQAHIVRI